MATRWGVGLVSLVLPLRLGSLPPLYIAGGLCASRVVKMASAADTENGGGVCLSASDRSPTAHWESRNGRLRFVWVPEVNSTQDEIKAMIAQKAVDPQDLLAVAASLQTHGRGTSGRAWVGLKGNAFLSIAIPRFDVSIPLTLLPLRMGTVVARELRRVLPAEAPLSLKWPNDVMLGEQKAGGLLIELDGDYFIVGIGINVAHAPDVPASGPNKGRPATCLAKHGITVTDETAMDLSLAISEGVGRWAAAKDDTGERVIEEWGQMTDWGKQHRLREDGRVVFPLGLEPDGRLRVRDASGTESLLTAEYLY